MAKIFRTETLNLGGNLRLESSSAGAFEIKSADGSTTHMSRASIESEISSLQAVDVKNESDLSVDVSSLQAGITGEANARSTKDASLDSDISSLQAVDVANESDRSVDISSLQAVDVANESDLSVDVSSLHAQDVTNESDLSVDISSLHAQDQGNDVVAKSVSQSSAAEDSGSIAFGRTFSSTPAVIAVLKSTSASDPIIACMVTAVSTSACTVSFADALPSANYTVEVFASLAD